MPAVTEREFHKGLTLQTEWRAQQERKRLGQFDDDEDDELSPEEQQDLDITTYGRELLRQAVHARRPFETFEKSWDLFNGVMFPPGMPRWQGKIVLNKLRQIVLFLQASMTDNKPRLNIQPAMEGTEKAANLIDKLVDREWDRTRAQRAHSMACFFGLVFGTGVVKWGRDPYARGGKGANFCDPVVSYRLFFNPGATCVADAEFIIQCERKPLGWIARHFPEKYKKVKRYAGTATGIEGAPTQRDLVQEGQPDVAGRYAIHTALSMDGHTVRVPREGNTLRDLYDQNMVDVYEFWVKDDATEEYDRHKVVKGVPQMEPVRDDEGQYVIERTGKMKAVPNPINGQPMLMPETRVKMRKIMETAKRAKYPNGRTFVMAGPVLLRDIPNPYEIDGFPYADWRDVDTGSIWGQGEPLQLKDANIGLNRSVTMLYNNLNLGGQLSWLVSKTSGINPDQLKNRPAAVFAVDGPINEAMKAVDRPQVSGEFINLFNVLDKTLPALAGLNDAITGGAAPVNVAFATMDQLLEQGAAAIRLRVRNLEYMYERSGEILVGLVQQFPDNDPLRIEETPESRYEYGEPDEDGERQVIAIVQPRSAVEIRWEHYDRSMIQGRVEVKITPDSTLSTSPAGLFNKLITLLDKKVIDQQYVLEKLNLEDGREVLLRMRAQAALQSEMKKKPGPKPKPAAQKEARAKPAPPSHGPTPASLAAVR